MCISQTFYKNTPPQNLYGKRVATLRTIFIIYSEWAATTNHLKQKQQGDKLGYCSDAAQQKDSENHLCGSRPALVTAASAKMRE